ncbi:MAG TPA: VWA domain-containing protein [Vicinamibacterales bacterium]|nr:VWA domain-containing protein [Vicinamibacterales bacterium]
MRAVVTVTTFVLAAGTLAGQAPHDELPRFKVAVDAVRIDAVVTDKDGRIVTDLTADDFVVLQNGKPQKVTFARFVPVPAGASSSAAPGVPRVSTSPADPSPSPSALMAPRSAIQRTLAIVVDDLGLSVDSLYYAKRGLHAFIDREVQPTDLVGIVRTGGSIGGLQPFTMDRRVLHEAIDNLRWNGFSRSGVEPFGTLNEWATFDDRSGLGDPNDFKRVDAFRRSIVATGTLGALNLAIRAARELPGRKAVMFVSEGFQMFDVEDTRVRAAVDRVIDQAARAGVVIYSLDPRGLQSGGLQASDDLTRGPIGSDGMAAVVRDRAQDRREFNRDTQEALAYVAEQTGGFAVLNTNNLERGFARISQDVRDYYIIGYAPEQGTFAGKGRKPAYHNIGVKVRRPELRVRTRKQFLGISDADEQEAPLSPAHQLIRAAISPFTSTDMALLATPLPGWSPDRGLFVRTLLHVDARALTFADGADGKRIAAADVLGMVFDADGTEVAHLTTGFEVALTDTATEEALRRGLAYTLLVPVARAGGYQFRFAIRDRQSGKLGSAGEFVDVADVPRGDFALSGIVLRAEDGSPRTGAATSISVAPEQALRVYRAGAPLTYAYEIYNAAERVEAAISVWRGDQRVASLPARTLPVPAGSGARVTAAGGLRLGESLPPGSYILQVAAATTDPKRAGRARTAVQFVQFDVR